MQAENERSGKLTEVHGKSLLHLARHTISERLRRASESSGTAGGDMPASGSVELPDNAELQRQGATFVTLKINGRLRGCMGSLQARESIIDSVKHNAINAAFNDPRFPALTMPELAAATIELSILTDPRPLAYEDAEDLLRRLTPGQDGLIIRKGSAGATFLPQVWDQLPRKEDFLTHLCLKAGLPGDTWRQATLDVSTYRVQHFEEEEA